ncbi:MAG: hypothetical protein ACRENG_27815 [bacterium]
MIDACLQNSTFTIKRISCGEEIIPNCVGGRSSPYGTGSDAWLGTRWSGTPAERQAILQDFSEAAAWGAAHNRPLNVGEYGKLAAEN